MGKADVFTGMSLTEKLIWLKKFGNGGSAPTYADRSMTGNPVIFTTNFAQNAKALSVDFAPKQNLNGFDHPWSGGSGKNLWKFGDDLVTQATQLPFDMPIPAGTYHLSGNVTGTLAVRFWYDGSSNVLAYCGNTVTFANDVVGATWWAKDLTASDIQLEAGSVATSFEPYKNICPITGMDSVDVVANSVTHEFDLGRTAYGGSLNANTGVLTIDKIKIPVSDSSMMPEGSNGWRAGTNANRIGFAIDTALLPKQNDSLDILCNIGYASANANTNNAFEVGACSLYKGNACMYFRFCVPTSITSVEDAYAFLKANNCEFTVPLETPLTYQLTAQQIALLEGQNVIATDGDSMSVTYQVKV